jgi:hypothetical protein
MIDVAVAGIYSFASVAHGQEQLEDIPGKLGSQSAKTTFLENGIANEMAKLLARRMPTIGIALTNGDAPSQRGCRMKLTSFFSYFRDSISRKPIIMIQN